MKYVLDHDMHIHSYLSPCSSDPEQTTKAILDYGLKAGYKHIVLTDHFWDEDVPCATDSFETADAKKTARHQRPDVHAEMGGLQKHKQGASPA